MTCNYCGHTGTHWIGMTGDMKPNFCVHRGPEGGKCKCERCPSCGSRGNCLAGCPMLEMDL